MNKERLLMLAEFLETRVPRDQWDFRHVMGPNWTGGAIECGTTACAIGWGTRIPELADAGLVMDFDLYKKDRWKAGYLLLERAEHVFELNADEIDYLFVPGRPGPNECADRFEVAAHIRAFVARGGMPEKDGES